jgi:hypothetical protein
MYSYRYIFYYVTKCSCDLFLQLEIVRSSNRVEIQFGFLFGNGLKNKKKNLFSPSHLDLKPCVL